MASSSSTNVCFQCRDSTINSFRDGWRLRNGECAQLCYRCASVYEEGRFCETFHSSDDGWRDCESCGKLVHCGCIVSFSQYFLLDFGGVICWECSKKNLVMARNRRFLLDFQTAPKHVLEFAKKLRIEPNYWPNAKVEIPKLERNVLDPLFEKRLTASDVDLKFGRIVIPKKYAEAFFPHVLVPRGIMLSVLDLDGNEYQISYRYWPNCGSRTYVLEGLRDMMISKELEAGDAVTFYRVEHDGRLVIGFRKVGVPNPPTQAST